jgi:hypothetical protein
MIHIVSANIYFYILILPSKIKSHYTTHIMTNIQDHFLFYINIQDQNH